MLCKSWVLGLTWRVLEGSGGLRKHTINPCHPTNSFILPCFPRPKVGFRAEPTKEARPAMSTGRTWHFFFSKHGHGRDDAEILWVTV